jgi:prepilin-type N-terminal cleavage/methylation domain-containing protein
MLERICNGPARAAGFIPAGINPAARRASRRGFTLIELLVAVGLLFILMGMALLVIPSVSDQQQSTRAATQLQQWIEIAKQRAARDRAPRGIRLLQGTVLPYQVTELQYTEQPPDFFLGNNATTPSIVSRAVCNTTGAAAPGPFTISFQMFNTATAAVATGANAALPRNLKGNGGNQPVQPGDYLDLAGQIFLVQSITGPRTLTVTSSFSLPANFTTTQYRFIRQPRPIGDDPLQMAENIIIDCQTRNVYNNTYDLQPYISLGPVDIMFAPDGRVIGQLASLDKIILWVRDVTLTDGQGDPALVCLYPRTGQVADCPVDLTNLTTTPYTFTSNGRRSSQ